MLSIPVLIEGGCHVDDRGTVSFVNGFNFHGVERFYWVQSVKSECNVGGWEHKWFTVVAGEVQVAVVQPDDWQSPSTDLPVARYVLSAASPQVLHVPAGHATGSISLTADAILMVFSSGTIANAPDDDFRFPVSQWPLGTI